MAKAPSHPPLKKLVVEAVVALKERAGSSLAAIKKAIGAKHPTAEPKRVGAAVKKLVAEGLLSQVKASFKLTDKAKSEAKPKKKAAPKKAAAAKPAAAKKPKATKPKAAKTTPKTKKAAAKPKAPKVKKNPTKKAAKPKTTKPKAAKKA